MAKTRNSLDPFDSAGATSITSDHIPDCVIDQSRAATASPQNTDGPRLMSESEMIAQGSIDAQAYPSGIPPEIQELMKNQDRIKTIYENCKDVNILITGVTGSGKSTLANAFLGRTEPGVSGARKEGEAIKGGCTRRVEGSISTLEQQIGIKVWDTPGLMDGTNTKEQKGYLEQILHVFQRYKSQDLVIFCIEAEGRFVPGNDNKNVQAMHKLTKKFGKRFWNNAIIVLTYANIIECRHINWRRLPLNGKVQAFKKVIQEYEFQIKSVMKSCLGIDATIVNNMKVVPAGHYDFPELIDRSYWFTTLWFACLHTIPTVEGRVAFAYNNRDRFSVSTPEDNPYTILLTDDFIPEELLACVKKYKIKGGLIGLLGLLGGPLAAVTILLGVKAGGKHGEAEYVKTVRHKQ